MSDTPSAKVLFRVPDGEGGAMVETLWAVPLGQDRFLLDNSPFYAYGVSWQDTVLAPVDEQEGMPAFQRVLERSGNRTIRVIFDPPVTPGNASDEVLQGLVSLGCSYEGANSRIYVGQHPAGRRLAAGMFVPCPARGAVGACGPNVCVAVPG